MLNRVLSRALVISALTFAAGAARAEPPPPELPAGPPPPAAPAADAAPPAAQPNSATVPAVTKPLAAPGHVYSPPGFPEPPDESERSEEAAPPPQTAPRWRGPRPGFDLGYGALPPLDIPFEQQPTYPEEVHMRSAGMVAGGVVLLSFGVVGLFAGSAMISAHEPTVDQPTTCFDCGGLEDTTGGGSSASNLVLKPGFQPAGIATLIGSAVAIGAAIPLIVIGAKKVPYTDASPAAAKAAALAPTVRVGPASATVAWQF